MFKFRRDFFFLNKMQKYFIFKSFFVKANYLSSAELSIRRYIQNAYYIPVKGRKTLVMFNNKFPFTNSPICYCIFEMVPLKCMFRYGLVLNPKLRLKQFLLYLPFFYCYDVIWVELTTDIRLNSPFSVRGVCFRNIV